MLYEVPAPNPYEIRILGQSRHIKKEALFYKGVGEKKKNTNRIFVTPGFVFLQVERIVIL